MPASVSVSIRSETSVSLSSMVSASPVGDSRAGSSVTPVRWTRSALPIVGRR